MTHNDIAAVAGLLPALGYHATPVEVAVRFEQLVRYGIENAVFVGELDDEVVGWVHVLGIRLLETNGYAEIGGLVVAPHRQRQGVGSSLLARAERWATELGYSRVRLRSGLHREAAHAFYEAVGYSKGRASYSFERLV